MKIMDLLNDVTHYIKGCMFESQNGHPEKPESVLRSASEKSDSNFPLDRLNSDLLKHILSFLELTDILQMSKVKKAFNYITQGYCGDHLKNHFGIFKDKSAIENKKCLLVLHYYYQGKKLLANGNEEEANKLFKDALKKLQTLCEAGKPWTHLYLAAMHFYAYGTERNLQQTKIHLEEIKKLWLAADRPFDSKHKLIRNTFANLVSNYHFEPTHKRDMQDLEFYHTHLSRFQLRATYP